MTQPPPAQARVVRMFVRNRRRDGLRTLYSLSRFFRWHLWVGYILPQEFEYYNLNTALLIGFHIWGNMLFF